MALPQFIIQNFRNLQNVNGQTMNILYANFTAQLSAMFPIQSAICSGIGSLLNNFGQSGTTNTFNFIDGVFRFPDQTILSLNNTIEPVFVSYNAQIVDITTPSPNNTIYYVAAQLGTFTNADSYRGSYSVNILPTAQTLAQIQGASSPTIPLFVIVFNGTNYLVGTDENCVINYGYILNPNSQSADFNRLISVSGVTYNITQADNFGFLDNTGNGTPTEYILNLDGVTVISPGFSIAIFDTGAPNTPILNFTDAGGQNLTLTLPGTSEYLKITSADGQSLWINGQPIQSYSPVITAATLPVSAMVFGSSVTLPAAPTWTTVYGSSDIELEGTIITINAAALFEVELVATISNLGDNSVVILFDSATNQSGGSWASNLVEASANFTIPLVLKGIIAGPTSIALDIAIGGGSPQMQNPCITIRQLTANP